MDALGRRLEEPDDEAALPTPPERPSAAATTPRMHAARSLSRMCETVPAEARRYVGQLGHELRAGPRAG